MSRAGRPALDRLALRSAQQRLLMLLVPLAAAGFVASATAGGAGLAAWSLLPTAMLALLAAAAPASAGPLVLVLWLGGYWVVAVSDRLSAWVLPAAVAVLVVHVASGLAAHGPASLTLGRATLARWLCRGGAVAGLTAAVWACCAVLVGRQPPGTVWLSGAALAVLAAGAAAAARRVGALRG